jgi:hypothetical protein
MSDADRPLAPLAVQEANLDTRPVSEQAVIVHDGVPDGERNPAPATTVDRLRAFEDQHLGKDVVRINGRIERGYGSPFQNPDKMPPELRRQHAALERVIETEQRLTDARTALLQAEADHEAALAATEPRSDGPAHQ